jgi:hypothetical protein
MSRIEESLEMAFKDDGKKELGCENKTLCMLQ